MLFERRNSITRSNAGSKDSHDTNKNSASATARSCIIEKNLRTPCYCEENIWRLAYRRIMGDLGGGEINNSKENEEYYVVFVSNEERCCPMLNQIASDHPMKPCFWDYHVVLMQSTKVVKKGKQVIQAQVSDMDTHLSSPCALEEYLEGTFNIDFADKKDEKKFAPLFRVVRAQYYLENFYSDRMHMMKDGEWLAKPPSYDCITTSNMKKNKKGHLSSLDDYVTMSKKSKGKENAWLGEVLTLKQLKSKFGI